MSGDFELFTLSRRRFIQALAMLAAQTRWPARLNAEGDAATALELWYDRPASRWVQALPIGNRRLGAMIFGEVLDEHLQLNDTLWSGPFTEAYQPLGDLHVTFAHGLGDAGGHGSERQPVLPAASGREACDRNRRGADSSHSIRRHCRRVRHDARDC